MALFAHAELSLHLLVLILAALVWNHLCQIAGCAISAFVVLYFSHYSVKILPQGCQVVTYALLLIHLGGNREIFWRILWSFGVGVTLLTAGRKSAKLKIRNPYPWAPNKHRPFLWIEVDLLALSKLLVFGSGWVGDGDDSIFIENKGVLIPPHVSVVLNLQAFLFSRVRALISHSFSI